MTLKGRPLVENPSRRRVLTAGLAGAAATALAGSRAVATTPTEPPSSGPEGTTGATAGAGDTGTQGTGAEGTGGEATPTTLGPERPTEGDVALLAFAQGAELAARDLYAAALAAGAAGDTDRVLQAAHDNHQAAADVISALIGVDAPHEPDAAVVEQWQESFESSDLAAVAAAGYELENTLMATHTGLVGQLENIDGATRLAALVIGEARLAPVLADLAGNGDDLVALFDNSAAALTPPEG